MDDNASHKFVCNSRVGLRTLSNCAEDVHVFVNHLSFTFSACQARKQSSIVVLCLHQGRIASLYLGPHRERVFEVEQESNILTSRVNLSSNVTLIRFPLEIQTRCVHARAAVQYVDASVALIDRSDKMDKAAADIETDLVVTKSFCSFFSRIVFVCCMVFLLIVFCSMLASRRSKIVCKSGLCVFR
jgi:hypothetical protein